LGIKIKNPLVLLYLLRKQPSITLVFLTFLPKQKQGQESLINKILGFKNYLLKKSDEFFFLTLLHAGERGRREPFGGSASAAVLSQGAPQVNAL
jgi:hypothetical protein